MSNQPCECCAMTALARSERLALKHSCADAMLAEPRTATRAADSHLHVLPLTFICPPVHRSNTNRTWASVECKSRRRSAQEENPSNRRPRSEGSVLGEMT